MGDLRSYNEAAEDAWGQEIKVHVDSAGNVLTRKR